MPRRTYDRRNGRHRPPKGRYDWSALLAEVTRNRERYLHPRQEKRR